MSFWQPIDKALRDGTRYLVCRRGLQGWSATASYSKVMGDWRYDDDRTSEAAPLPLKYVPTHFKEIGVVPRELLAKPHNEKIIEARNPKAEGQYYARYIMENGELSP